MQQTRSGSVSQAGVRQDADLPDRAITPVAQRVPGRSLPSNGEVQAITQRLGARQAELAGLLEAAKLDIGNVRNYFKLVNGVYDRSYGHYQLVLNQANAAADSQQVWVDLVVGVATGLAVGALFEATLAAKAAQLSVELLSEAAAEAVEGVVGLGTKATGITEIPKAQVSDELNPAWKQVAALQKLDELNQAVVQLAIPGTYLYSSPLMLGERLSGEIRVAEAGGTRNMTDAEVRAAFDKLKTFDQQSAQNQVSVKAAKEKFDCLRQSYSSKQQPPDLGVEQDIWIPWIAKQDPIGNVFFGSILSNKVIANHLVDIQLAARGAPGGRLNADISGSRVRDTYADPITGEPKSASPTMETPSTQLRDGASNELPMVKLHWREIFLMGA